MARANAPSPETAPGPAAEVSAPPAVVPGPGPAAEAPEVADLRARLAEAVDYIRRLEADPATGLRRPGLAPLPPHARGTLRTYRAVHNVVFDRDAESRVTVPAGTDFEAAPEHLAGLRPGSYRPVE